MRRDYSKNIEPSDAPDVNIPLSPSLLDTSGNGYDATLVSGTIATQTIDGESWGDLRNASIRLANPQQLSYINDFKLEVELYVISLSSPQYYMAVDGFDDGSKYKGVKIGTSWGELFAAGIGVQRNRSDDWTYGFWISRNNIPTNTPIKVTIENRNNQVSVTVLNMSTGTEIGSRSETTPTFTQVSYSYLQLGRDARYADRYFNGYMRNLKLWF